MNYLWYNELRHSDLHNIIKVLTDSSILPKKCFFFKEEFYRKCKYSGTENFKDIIFTISLFNVMEGPNELNDTQLSKNKNKMVIGQ